MRTRSLTIIAAALLALLVLGCAPTRTQMDFGTSYQLAKFSQIQNPQAEKNLKPVEGMDGQAAQNAVDKYRKDFEKPAPAQNFSISISGK
jgi:hypothetical protein